MPAVILYRGTVEVETLTRYGRVRAGTRAVGEIVVSDTGGLHLPLQRVFTITIGNDPRPFGWTVSFSRMGTEGKPQRWSRMFRGESVSFTAHSFTEFLTQDLTCDIEGHSTSHGNQQFRVIRIEWEQEN